MTKPTKREERSHAVARTIGESVAGSSRLPFVLARESIAAATRTASGLVATPTERREVKRRAAEALLMLACSKREAWATMRWCYSKVEALGFSDAGRQVQDAVLLARWCIDNEANREFALSELRRAKLRVARLRRDRSLRKRLLSQIADFERLLGGGA